jgi:hypothetical protein
VDPSSGLQNPRLTPFRVTTRVTRRALTGSPPSSVGQRLSCPHRTAPAGALLVL